jgi:hypothetical protein
MAIDRPTITVGIFLNVRDAITPLRPREPLGPDLRMFLDMIVDANEKIVSRHPDHLLPRLKLPCHAEAKPKHLDQREILRCRSG